MKLALTIGWIDTNGEFHKAGSVIDVESGVARNLITRGLARVPETKRPTRRSATDSPAPVPNNTAATGSDTTNAATGTKRKVKS